MWEGWDIISSKEGPLVTNSLNLSRKYLLDQIKREKCLTVFNLGLSISLNHF